MTLSQGIMVMPFQPKTEIMTAIVVIALCSIKEPGGIITVTPLI